MPVQWAGKRTLPPALLPKPSGDPPAAMMADSLPLLPPGDSDRYRLSWYDALTVAAAIEGQCSLLYSEDLQHRQRFGDLQVENPFL